jgi:hypothetical protein
MLKNRIPNTDLILNTSISSKDYSSDRDFYNNRLLNFTKNNVINGVIDSEIYEYQPEQISEINFNLFFLRYLQANEFSEMRKYTELDFDKQYDKTRQVLGLIDRNGIVLDKAINNVFETRQSNGLREAPVLAERTVSRFQELKQKPYYVRDIVGESFLKKPIKSGIPIFYNTFTLPFWDSKDKWINEPLLYTNKPYFYNSFLLMEFYDSPSNFTQNRIQSIPIFVNSRYNITEKNRTNNFHYERPCFKLQNGSEGFSFFFLNNYITNEFYVRYSFWDALNAKKILLLPSTDLDLNKKWIQDPNNFNQNNRYLKYVLDYENKTYKIYEFNPVTKEFDSERSNFDLYELEFDSYYKNKIAINEPPINSKSVIPPQQKLSNPFTFSVKNLYTNNFVGDGSGKVTPLTSSEINSLNTFLGGNTKPFIEKFNNYNSNINLSALGALPKKTITIPVIDREVEGFNVLLKAFTFKNNDNITWTIRGFEFKDIEILIDGVKLNDIFYNQRESLWNEKPNFKVCETIGLVRGTFDTSSISQSSSNFTKKIIEKYIEDSDIFKKFLNIIERDRYNNVTIASNDSYGEYEGTGYIDTDMAIPTFLDKCFRILKVRYRPGQIKTKYYGDYAVKPPSSGTGNGTVDRAFSEIYYYIDTLVQNYINLKKTNYNLFLELKNDIIGLLDYYYYNRTDYGNIVYDTVTNINTVVSPKDNPELIEEYFGIASLKKMEPYLTSINNITLNALALKLDAKPGDDAYGLFNKIRNYTFTLFAIQSGDKFMVKNERNKVEVYFNIGEYIKGAFTQTSEILIKGRLRMSIIDGSGNIKNIVIPIKSRIKPKQKNNSVPPLSTQTLSQVQNSINSLT